MDIRQDFVDAVGNTPLIKLRQASELTGCTILGKAEFANPGGSVKDRAAKYMVLDGERRGVIEPGGLIVEGTAGNTGIGLALVGKSRGYRTLILMPNTQSQEKKDALRLCGAELREVPAVPYKDPNNYVHIAARTAKELEATEQHGVLYANQWDNHANRDGHTASTGPEIWAQTDGKITHFVTGMGTGGTISGVGRYLKEQNPDIQVIGADPAGSVYSGGTGRPYLVEGVGEDFWPETYDRGVADRVIEVSDADSFAFTRRLAREEAMLVGGSAGMAAFAARQVAHELAAEGRTDAVVVVLLPDSGRGYLTKVFNDDWLGQYGFATGSPSDRRTVGEVLRGKSGQLPDLVHTHPSETIAEAVHIFQEYGVSQMPVVRAEPPIVAAEVAGSVSVSTLLDALYAGEAKLNDPVEDHMSAALPTIGSSEAAADAVRLLEKADAVLVHEDGKPIGVLTRQDLLTFVAAS
jgi:cystathionine beta-synthase